MILLPVAIPVTIPDKALTVACAVVPLLQVPPDGVPLNIRVRPTQILESPLILCSGGETVTTTLPVSEALQELEITLSRL